MIRIMIVFSMKRSEQYIRVLHPDHLPSGSGLNILFPSFGSQDDGVSN
jgi:hypothetical protein